MYKDPYLAAVCKSIGHDDPLLLLLCWINVRKGVKLPEDPIKLVEQFLSSKEKDLYLAAVSKSIGYENQLLLLVCWINVRKRVILPEDPIKLVEQFSALEKVG